MYLKRFYHYSKYSVARTTQNLKVTYYVKENFHSEYDGNLKRLEHLVEEEYMNLLRHSCYREKNYSKYYDSFVISKKKFQLINLMNILIF